MRARVTADDEYDRNKEVEEYVNRMREAMQDILRANTKLWSPTYLFCNERTLGREGSGSEQP